MTFYPLSHDNWDEQEKDALYNVIKSNKFTMGEEVLKFEKKIANFHNTKHAVMVNSGSSANLLMIASLFEQGKLKRGDEVIVPAVSWSTTYFPLHHYDLKLVFVDTERFGNIDPNKVKIAITKKTKAVLAVNLLGFPANLVELKKICNKNQLLLLEDNCESFGAKIKNKHCGTWGLLGTLSFFYSHHLCTMEGGCVLTNDNMLADTLKILRAHGWIRDAKNKKDWGFTGNDFKDSFLFVLPGYNLRPLEMSAAVGIVQLKKWKNQIRTRLSNAKLFTEVMKGKEVLTPEYDPNSSWFGFPLICKSKKARLELLKRCKKEGIESRPIVAGNFTTQPVIKKLNHKISGELLNSNIIEERGLFFGNDNRNLEKQLKKLSTII